MKSTILTGAAALILAGCASIDGPEDAAAGASEFLLLASAYGATIDGAIDVQTEAIPYARAAVETFGGEIPIRWVGTINIVCDFIDTNKATLDVPEGVLPFCEEVVANIPAPA